MTKTNHYVVSSDIYKAIMSQKRVANVFLVLLTSSYNFETTISEKELCIRANTTLPTVKKALCYLKNMGIISATQRKGYSNVWKINSEWSVNK